MYDRDSLFDPPTESLIPEAVHGLVAGAELGNLLSERPISCSSSCWGSRRIREAVPGVRSSSGSTWRPWPGLSEAPGELSGFGPVIADIARQVAREQRHCQWTWTVTDPETGIPVHTGVTRRRPNRETRRWVATFALASG